jgi:hypothetical protein
MENVKVDAYSGGSFGNYLYVKILCFLLDCDPGIPDTHHVVPGTVVSTWYAWNCDNFPK